MGSQTLWSRPTAPGLRRGVSAGAATRAYASWPAVGSAGEPLRSGELQAVTMWGRASSSGAVHVGALEPLTGRSRSREPIAAAIRLAAPGRRRSCQSPTRAQDAPGSPDSNARPSHDLVADEPGDAGGGSRPQVLDWLWPHQQLCHRLVPSQAAEAADEHDDNTGEIFGPPSTSVCIRAVGRGGPSQKRSHRQRGSGAAKLWMVSLDFVPPANPSRRAR
jgi:hypothetical protein